MEEALPLVVLLTLATFGTYRVSRMVPKGEDGPFEIFRRLREWALMHQGGWIGAGLLCYFCISFWVSLGFAALLPHRGPGEFVLYWLGLAGLSVALYRWLD